jgi:L-lactate dehydrogenase complex protein LldE
MPRVGLFIPCYIDQFYPQVGLATVEVLERFGCQVEFPAAQTCCGQPMANTGCVADAAPLAQAFIRIFQDYEYVVCPSGSCAAMVRQHYAEFFHGDPVYEQLRTRLFELSEFLVDVLKVEKIAGKFPHRVGLHQSCHVTLTRADECCGFGGTFAVNEEAVSCMMGLDRIHDHEQAGAEVLTANDMSCLMHLAGLIQRQNKPLRVLHFAEILATAGKM